MIFWCETLAKMVNALCRLGTEEEEAHTEIEGGRTPRYTFLNKDLKIQVVLEHACVLLAELPKVGR